MSVPRLTRVNELLKREIADALFHIMNERRFDLAAVTITKVEASPNLRHAVVSVSIRGNDSEREMMLRQLKGHRVQIQSIVNKDLVLKYTPVLRFVHDESVEKGDKILNVLLNMEHEQDEKDSQDKDQ